MPPTLGLTGDLMLGRKVDERQSQRQPDAVWGDVLDSLQALDGLLGNLECAISVRGREWTRTERRFHFRANPDWAMQALESAGVDALNFANNHALDYEVEAFEDTLDHLADADIEVAGAGRTLDEALDPAVVSVGDYTVAVVGFTDNTPEYAAGEDSPGVAYVECDPEDDQTRERVTEALDRARAADPDLLVASLHWGPNMVAEPAAEYREFGRWLVDRGVDLIHGHSAHVFQGTEVYDGAPICYDTGDFVDDYVVHEDLRNDHSFRFEVEIADGAVSELRLYPVELYDRSVHEAVSDAAEWACDAMRERSEPFGTTFERDGEALVLPVE